MDMPADRQTCWQDCDRLGVDAVRLRLLEPRSADPAWHMHAQDWLRVRQERQAQLTYRLVLMGIAGSALAILALAIL